MTATAARRARTRRDGGDRRLGRAVVAEEALLVERPRQLDPGHLGAQRPAAEVRRRPRSHAGPRSACPRRPALRVEADAVRQQAATGSDIRRPVGRVAAVGVRAELVMTSGLPGSAACGAVEFATRASCSAPARRRASKIPMYSVRPTASRSAKQRAGVARGDATPRRRRRRRSRACGGAACARACRCSAPARRDARARRPRWRGSNASIDGWAACALGAGDRARHRRRAPLRRPRPEAPGLVERPDVLPHEDPGRVEAVSISSDSGCWARVAFAPIVSSSSTMSVLVGGGERVAVALGVQRQAGAGDPQHVPVEQQPPAVAAQLAQPDACAQRAVAAVSARS